jgi:hypothetical protein
MIFKVTRKDLLAYITAVKSFITVAQKWIIIELFFSPHQANFTVSSLAGKTGGYD